MTLLTRDEFEENGHLGDWCFVDHDTAIWLNIPYPDDKVVFTSIRLRIRFRKPIPSPATWGWNGNKEKPTLEPSINTIGIWHGWLRDGNLVTA